MAKKGLLIEYYWCTGCHTCEVACQQEHDYPAGKCGIVVNESIMQTSEKPSIYYLPFPTDLCDLCAARTRRGEKPACVKHCQADCMRYGPLEELVKEMGRQPKTVLFSPH